jgi:MoxR-like ATPase
VSQVLQRRWLTVASGEPIALQGASSEVVGSVSAGTTNVHVFDEQSIDAVNAALAARRPLLVRGEPGTGKSQLARAVAHVMKRVLISEVVDGHTDARDLMWRFDAVGRLAEAQLLGALKETLATARQRLAERRFVTPGPLWWAFDWAGALEHLTLVRGEDATRQTKEDLAVLFTPPSGWKPSDGCVLLIDEIDKAEADVPNGLLACLADGAFRPLGCQTVTFANEQPPLVIITTNEERALPEAFVRRCLVLHLDLPTLPEEKSSFISLMCERGHAHFPDLAAEVLTAAAELTVADRQLAIERRAARPGQAEYLDLLRAVHEQFGQQPTSTQLIALNTIAAFTIRKHRAHVDA